jgi:hypothetical protein
VQKSTEHQRLLDITLDFQVGGRSGSQKFTMR